MITCKTVRAIFTTLVDMLPSLPKPYRYALTEWRPGDGMTRYQIAVIGRGAEWQPFGSTSWLGSREAYTAIQAMVNLYVAERWIAKLNKKETN